MYQAGSHIANMWQQVKPKIYISMNCRVCICSKLHKQDGGWNSYI